MLCMSGADLVLMFSHSRYAFKENYYMYIVHWGVTLNKAQYTEISTTELREFLGIAGCRFCQEEQMKQAHGKGRHCSRFLCES